MATSLGKNQPFRYRGYVYDTETQWYYLQSRYYDPNTCRFISSDVYLSTGQGVLGHNSYAYCNNNPIRSIDEAGNRPRDYNLAYTDGGSFNSYYSRTGAFKSKEDKDLVEKLNRSGGKTYRPHTHITRICVKETEYKHSEDKLAEFVGRVTESVAPSLIAEIVALSLSNPPAGLIFAIGIGLGVAYSYVSEKPKSPLVEGVVYNSLVVTISGYERDSLTGRWLPYTETMEYASVPDGKGLIFTYYLVDYKYSALWG